MHSLLSRFSSICNFLIPKLKSCKTQNTLKQYINNPTYIDYLPLELITTILHYLPPSELRYIVENKPEWKPWVMAMNRKAYIEKWHPLYPQKNHIYYVKEKDDLATVIQNYWFMDIRFDNTTYQKITHDFPQIPNSKYLYLDVSWTNISDVSMLGGLHTLDCTFTHVSDVSMLGGLHTLNCSHTSVSDVSMLEGKVKNLYYY